MTDQIQSETEEGVRRIMAATTDLPTDIPLIEVAKIISDEFDSTLLTLALSYHLNGRKEKAIRQTMKRVFPSSLPSEPKRFKNDRQENINQ